MSICENKVNVKIGLSADVIITDEIKSKMKQMFPEACELYNEEETIGLLYLYHIVDKVIPEILLRDNLNGLNNITLD